MKKFVLRKDPFFQITLSENSIEIYNSEYTSNNGIYKFEEIKSVEIMSSKIDWFPSILGNFLAFFGGHFGFDKTDDRLIFSFHSAKKMEVKLINSDLKVANKLLIELKKRIHS